MTSTSRESVFVARNTVDETVAEETLTAAGIDYTIATEATGKPDGAVCFLSLVYQVEGADAARARALLEARGLGRGVLPARA